MSNDVGFVWDWLLAFIRSFWAKVKVVIVVMCWDRSDVCFLGVVIGFPSDVVSVVAALVDEEVEVESVVMSVSSDVSGADVDMSVVVVPGVDLCFEVAALVWSVFSAEG